MVCGATGIGVDTAVKGEQTEELEEEGENVEVGEYWGQEVEDGEERDVGGELGVQAGEA